MAYGTGFNTVSSLDRIVSHHSFSGESIFPTLRSRVTALLSRRNARGVITGGISAPPRTSPHKVGQFSNLTVNCPLNVTSSFESCSKINLICVNGNICLFWWGVKRRGRFEDKVLLQQTRHKWLLDHIAGMGWRGIGDGGEDAFESGPGVAL